MWKDESYKGVSSCGKGHRSCGEGMDKRWS